MKSGKIWIVVVGVILLLGACRKNDGITISGIVARDENGTLAPANGTDPSDWTFDGSVPDNILTILKGLPVQYSAYAGSDPFDPLNPVGMVQTMAYPNPNHGTFVLQAKAMDAPYGYAYVVVDANLNVKASGALNGRSYIATIDISSMANGLYRVYYIYRGQDGSVIYQGYGDIKKQ